MLNLYPDEYYYDDMFGTSHDPWSRRQQLRRAQLQRQAAMEEERRQRILYERAMREELLRREAQEEAMRRRRIMEQKRIEEAMRQQALEERRREAERRRRILEQQWQRQRQKELELENQLELERMEKEKSRKKREALVRNAEYGIVRGPDGRLYRLADDDDYMHMMGFPLSKPVLGSSGTSSLAERRKGLTMPVQTPSFHDDEVHNVSASEESDSDTASSSDASMNTEMEDKKKTPAVKTREKSDGTVKASNVSSTKKTETSAGKKSKSRRKSKSRPSELIGVVEDASDSEQEDVLSSVWRNRLPSKGEWMEPVDAYDVYW